MLKRAAIRVNRYPSALAGRMIPLDGTEPTLPLDDLEPLREIVGEARIVALGEPTHGQREIFQLKHRVIRYLVSELGFTTFVLEASAVACREMSRFVLEGTGDPGRALKMQGFWTWYTEEVLELLLWLREWNLMHPEQPVDVAGNDVQEARTAYTTVTRFLGTYDTSLVVDYASCLDAIASINLISDPYDPALHRRHLEMLDKLEGDVAALEGPGDDEIAMAIDDLLAMRQFLSLWEADTETRYANARDKAMADRTAALATATPDTKIALWAHNAHISKSTQAYVPHEVVPMGMRLKARFVEDYLSVGILFGKGSYQAMTSEGQSYRLDMTDVGPPPNGTLDGALFDASDASASLVDLHTLPEALSDWLAEPRTVRMAGAVGLISDDMESELHILRNFDVLAFVRETTRARPLGDADRGRYGVLKSRSRNATLSSSAFWPSSVSRLNWYSCGREGL